MKLGIVQGRLTPPDEGHQTTPRNWESEFFLLDELGLDHIEWVIDDSNLLSNPILKKNTIPEKFKERISTVCFDHIVNEKAWDERWFMNNTMPIIECLKRAKINHITIPLLEDLSITSAKQLVIMKKYLLRLISTGMKVNIEPDFDSEVVLDLLTVSQNINVTYDIGNIHHAGFKCDKYINDLCHRITCVHLKNRTRKSGISITALESMFTDGVNFYKVFDNLEKKKYKGIYTLQMARGVSGDEKQHIKKYIEHFRSLSERS